jgi:DNA-binding response OmpR family regulator
VNSSSLVAIDKNRPVADNRQSDDPQTVLLVEDDDRIASFLITGLRAKGFAVQRVETGQAAIDAVEHEETQAHPLLVALLDLGLPDINGLDVLRHWSATGASIRTIVLTARSDPRDRSAATSLGAVAYLTKPAPFRDIVAAVTAAFRSAY